MDSSRLSTAGRLLLALLAVFALGTIVASAARAEEAHGSLRWKVEGKELGKNETREITITRWSANPAIPTPVVIEPIEGTIKVKCEIVSTAKGTSFLTNESVGATSKAVASLEPEFSKCLVTGNGESCKVAEPIKLKSIRPSWF